MHFFLEKPDKNRSRNPIIKNWTIPFSTGRLRSLEKYCFADQWSRRLVQIFEIWKRYLPSTRIRRCSKSPRCGTSRTTGGHRWRHPPSNRVRFSRVSRCHLLQLLYTVKNKISLEKGFLTNISKYYVGIR